MVQIYELGTFYPKLLNSGYSGEGASYVLSQSFDKMILAV